MEESSRKMIYLKIISTKVLLGMFAVAALILTNIGVSTYKKILEANSCSTKLRKATSYVAEKIRKSDRKGAVSLEVRDSKNILVLEEIKGQSTYEILIYFDKGTLYEKVHKKGMEDLRMETEGTTVIEELGDFQMEWPQENMLRFKAVCGKQEESLCVNLRTRR